MGVDWGVETHQACVLDAAGEVAGERAFAHGGEGLSALADEEKEDQGGPRKSG